jgi:hypothetical protein
LLLFASLILRIRLGTSRLRRVHGFETAPAVSIANARSGLVKVCGHIQANEAGVLTSPLMGRPCVAYRILLERLTGSVARGGNVVTVLDVRDLRPFWLSDDSGRLGVDATGAIWLGPKQSIPFDPRTMAWLQGQGVSQLPSRPTLTEQRLEAGQTATVQGFVTAGGSAPLLRTGPAKAQEIIVSTHPPNQPLVKAGFSRLDKYVFRAGCLVCIVALLAAIAAGVVVYQMWQDIQSKKKSRTTQVITDHARPVRGSAARHGSTSTEVGRGTMDHGSCYGVARCPGSSRLSSQS